MKWAIQTLLAIPIVLSGCGGGGGGSPQASVGDSVTSQALPALEISISEIEFRKLGSDEPLQPVQGN